MMAVLYTGSDPVLKLQRDRKSGVSEEEELRWRKEMIIIMIRINEPRISSSLF